MMGWPKMIVLMIFTALLCGNANFCLGQTSADTAKAPKVVQFSGMVIDSDSLFPIPFVAIVVKGTARGVYSTGSGYYSIVLEEHDTLEFYSLGYKTGVYIVPDTFTTSQVNHVQTLQMDTVFLTEMIVYPWPSREQFKNSFLAADIPNDDLERARMNLAQQRMIAATQNITADGQGAYSSAMQQRTDKNYSAGQYQPNNLLNPIAWAKFIQSMRDK